MDTDGSGSAIAVYEQPRVTLIPSEQTTNSAFALAKLAAASGLCKTKKPEDAFFVIMHGYEIGIPAMTALRTIHIINGVPVTSGEALLAIIRRSNKVDIKIEGSATEATVWMKRRDSGEEYKATWTIARATTAGLTTKQTWKNFPQAFLQWRGVGECSKFLCSDITNGLYPAEEIAPDLNYDESGEPIDAPTITISKPEEQKSTEAPAPFAVADAFKDGYLAGKKAAEPPAPKMAGCVAVDKDCQERLEALLKELDIKHHKPYFDGLSQSKNVMIRKYSEHPGTFDELLQNIRDLHEAFTALMPDPEDDSEYDVQLAKELKNRIHTIEPAEDTPETNAQADAPIVPCNGFVIVSSATIDEPKAVFDTKVGAVTVNIARLIEMLNFGDIRDSHNNKLWMNTFEPALWKSGASVTFSELELQYQVITSDTNEVSLFVSSVKAIHDMRGNTNGASAASDYPFSSVDEERKALAKIEAESDGTPVQDVEAGIKAAADKLAADRTKQPPLVLPRREALAAANRELAGD